MRISIIMFVALFIFGCSAIDTMKLARTQTVLVKTPFADGASCTLTDARGRRWKVRSTPNTAIVEDGQSPLQVICKKAGFKNTVETVSESKEELLTIDGKRVTVGIYNQFPTKAPRLIPTAIKEASSFALDPTGSLSTKYPNEITIWMEPEVWQSEEEMRQWAYERSVWENGEVLQAADDKARDDERKAVRRSEKLARAAERQKMLDKLKKLGEPDTYVNASEEGTKKLVTGVKTVGRSVGASALVVGKEIKNDIDYLGEKAAEYNPEWMKNNPNLKPSQDSAIDKTSWKPNWTINKTNSGTDKKTKTKLEESIKKLDAKPAPVGDVPPWITEKGGN
jgi:hypothetical protein